MGYRTSWGLPVAAALLACCTAGCETANQTAAVGTAVVTAFGATAPTQEIEQTYYFGVLDPEDQLPCAVYRVRVHGQASSLSGMKFASGWTHAALTDSLGTRLRFGAKDAWLEGTTVSEADTLSLPTGRKLVLFGPEGFRPAPKDHRLVIMMGADPSAFFEAMDRALGEASKTAAEIDTYRLSLNIEEEASQMSAERESLDALSRDIDKELPAGKEVTQ